MRKYRYDDLSTVAGVYTFSNFAASGNFAMADEPEDGKLIRGTNRADVLNGTEGADQVYGGLGNDTLNGKGGGDAMFGGEGNDKLDGGDGLDDLNGEEGNDTLTLGEQDWGTGGTGADTFIANGNVTIFDFTTADTLIVNNVAYHADDLEQMMSSFRASGTDAIITIEGRDVTFYERAAGFPDEPIRYELDFGGRKADKMKGTNDADMFMGNGGNDKLTGKANTDNLIGGTGNDTLNGGADNDILQGDSGNDTFIINGGYDQVFAGDMKGDAFTNAGKETFIIKGDGEIISLTADDVFVDGASKYGFADLQNLDHTLGPDGTTVHFRGGDILLVDIRHLDYFEF